MDKSSTKAQNLHFNSQTQDFKLNKFKLYKKSKNVGFSLKKKK